MDELLKQRDSIHSSFSVVKTPSGSNLSNGSSSKAQGEESKGDGDSVGEEGLSESRDKSKRKWFNLNLKGYDKKLGWPHLKADLLCVIGLFIRWTDVSLGGCSMCRHIYTYNIYICSSEWFYREMQKAQLEAGFEMYANALLIHCLLYLLSTDLSLFQDFSIDI